MGVKTSWPMYKTHYMHFIRELYERNELTVNHEVCQVVINTNNAPVNILSILAESIREGWSLNARHNWEHII